MIKSMRVIFTRCIIECRRSHAQHISRSVDVHSPARIQRTV